ncbi:hypothetical protein RPMA_09840 [Tardiphaga alba]|uniref:Uncharacterized protein n=1 Tax=Tardiphaga alba TaxID=340268 RepID=A0ABX8A5W2_9BRAD|nr:hypothetical protein [Tardiphaga alba]QUS39104.1 hypothetical protein RPMA_09840 [Tardiphaga alba]
MNRENEIEVPFGVAEVLTSVPDWRSRFEWPISSQIVFASATALLSRLNDLIVAIDEPSRRILLLGRSFNRAAALLEAALAVQAERSRGIRLTGPQDLAILRRELPFDSKVASNTMLMVASGKRATLKRLRQVARTASWSKPLDLPRAVLAPNGIVLTHNKLLVSDVRQRGLILRYEAVDYLFDRYIKHTPADARPLLSGDALDELIERTLATIINDPALDGDTASILLEMMRPIVTEDLNRASATLAALDNSSVNFPKLILGGTAGSYRARAIGMAAMRRGNIVRRYDHGGTASLMADRNFLVQQELAVSTEFVMPTQTATRAVEPAANSRTPLKVAKLEFSYGDPGLDPGPLWRHSRGSQSKRSALYVGTAYYGFSQTFPPFPPSPVYIDWQHRLLEALKRLPIKLSHKPHPGGLMRGQPTFLAEHGPMLTNRFENALAQSDVLILDIAASTTLATAMCTEHPIVLLDFGCMPFNQFVEIEVRKRCRVIPVTSDDRNRLIVDEQLLREAVCGGPDREDPSFFRSFFLDL